MTPHSPESPGVCHLVHTDITGGAARAAYMLHRGLQDAGTASTMLVREKASRDPTVQKFQPRMGFQSRLLRRFARCRRDRKFRAFPAAAARGNDCLLNPADSDFPDLPRQLPADTIINLHWVSGFIDVPTFFHRAGSRRRFVWTMHDMWALSGGCHYSGGCARFADQCGACPQILSQHDADVTRTVWQQKLAGYAAMPDDSMVVVTPSEWLGREAKRSSLLGRFDVRVIPYGIDLTAFAPRDRGFSRETLGIPADAFVMAFVADFVTGPRKGFSVLTKALDELPAALRKDVWLISVGGGHPSAPAGYGSAHFGRVHNDRLLSLFYSAADLFVLPTLEDNLPTTALESLACGTPVLGSDVGGVPDMVRNDETGWLFPVGDASALAARLSELIAGAESVDGLRGKCRAAAEREYPSATQAKRYQTLYRELSSRG